MGEGTLIGQGLIVLTTILGFAFQIYRENRNRKWDMEDRERARQELSNKVTSAAVATVVHQERVMKKIEENTEISRVAFNEANSVNAKLLALGIAINAPYERKASGIHQRASELAEIRTAVEDTKHTAEDTLATVQKIDEKLP